MIMSSLPQPPTGTASLDKATASWRRRTLGFAMLVVVALIGSRVAFPSDVALPDNTRWVIPGLLLIGGQPQDINLVRLKDQADLGAIINLRPDADPIEAAVARSFHLEYMHIAISARRAPSLPQLSMIARWAHMNARRHTVILIHDEFGKDQVMVVAAQLLVLRGVLLQEALARASHEPGPADLSVVQLRAVEAAARLSHSSPLAVP